jgi:hypothetical protein
MFTHHHPSHNDPNRVLRPDKLVAAIHSFVAAALGRAFVEPPPFDLEK